MAKSLTQLKDAAGLPAGLSGPRGSIVIELKRSEPLTARDLADRVGLSLNAIRHHLKELEAGGLVRHEREARGVGAPVHAYHLTNQAERLFPRRYEETLAEVLDHVVASEGRAQAVELLESRFRRLGRRLASDLEGLGAGERAALVADALSHEGFMAVWDGDGAGGTLTAHNCAVHSVALRFPELCEAEQRFLASVLTAAVDREGHMLNGCSTCEYRIDFRPPIGRNGEEHA